MYRLFLYCTSSHVHVHPHPPFPIQAAEIYIHTYIQTKHAAIAARIASLARKLFEEEGMYKERENKSRRSHPAGDKKTKREERKRKK